MYNNPYNFYPYLNQVNTPLQGGLAGNTLRAARPSLLGAFSRIKWGSVLNNTQKTLNVINQAIPVYYQVKPIASNLKNFSKIMRAFNETSKEETNSPLKSQVLDEKKEETSLNAPTFFIN